MLGLCRNKYVLDIGCVYSPTKKGWLHGKIAEIASHAVGIDTAKNKVKHLRQEGYDIRYADAQSFDLGERFDVIVAADLIEHLPNPGMFLDSVRKHLNKDGKLIITTNNAQGLIYFLRRLFSNGRTWGGW